VRFSTCCCSTASGRWERSPSASRSVAPRCRGTCACCARQGSFAPGGTADTLGRIVAQKLGEHLKASFIVENRPGAGGALGSELASNAAPDGYTLVVSGIASHVIAPMLPQGTPYDPVKDFTHVALFGGPPAVLAVHPSVQAKDLKEFVALAKSQPGQLNYASSGPGTPYHMAGELFKAMSGTNIVHVPHRSSGDMRNSVIGGHVQMMFDAITVMAQGVQSGQLKALGTSGKQRSSVLPNVPTIDEAGVPGYEATIWLGIMAPTGTPKPIVDKLNSEVKKILARTDIKEAWAKQGATPMLMTPEEFDKYLRGDIEKWAHVVKVSGAKTD
jgi:tripartite-type tricarboxylate transporter receptor subunit TctC